MEHFHGALLDGDRVLLGRVSGVFEGWGDLGDRLGRMESHEGSAPALDTGRPYRLALNDGNAWDVFVTGMRRSGLAGITMLEFRAPAESAPRVR